MGFYQDTTTTYGVHVTIWLKRWSKLNSKKASFINRRIYLLECKRNGVGPKHITQNIKNLHNLLDGAPAPLIRKMHHFNSKVAGKILNFEISHTNCTLRSIDKEMNKLHQNIVNVLPSRIYEKYFLKQNTLFNKIFHKIKEKNLDKIQKLVNENKANWKTSEKWFKNISSKQIPHNVELVLSLGPKFNLHTTVKDINLEILLAHVEQLVSKIQESKRNLVRSKITSIITSHIHRFKDVRNLETKLINEVKQFLRENDELLVLKSDKGGVTVVMDKAKYNEGIEVLLNNNNSFRKLNRDPTLTVQNKANAIITDLVKHNYISPEEGKTMKIYNANAPKIYGNPKVHKDGYPLRPIISSIQGPTNNIAKYIATILKNAYNTDNEYYITDSFHFSSVVNNLKIPDNYVLISLDVVNLFGSLTKNIINEVIKARWETIKTYANGLTEKKFLEITDFVLDNNYFSYNQKFYIQILGCAMGSKLSPILAQYVMDYVLDQSLQKLPFKPTFVKKFVDDLIVALPADQIQLMLNTVNQFDNNIQFTIEKEVNRAVPFLDTLVRRDVDSNTIKLDWYRKPSAAGRYVHYKSNHNINIKVNFVKQMRHRITNICHAEFKNKNLKILENLLVENGYPLSMIRSLIYSSSSSTEAEGRMQTDRDQTDISYGVLPYYNDLTDRLVKVFHQENIKVAKKSTKSVGSLFSNLKDKTPKGLRSNVVYKLTCSTCSDVYVGQTSQWLKSRIALHKSDVKKGVDRCALVGHIKGNPNHRINYGNVEILESDRNYERRLFLEMVNINRLNNNMNKKSDTQNLNVIYTYLLECAKNNNHYDGALDE